MRPLITPAAMGDMERRYFAGTGTPSIDLMERAARAMCDALLRRFGRGRRVIFACGPGGNGGDGYACARLYAERGLLTVSGENTVDYHDVHAWFNRLEKEYEILPLKVGYDRYSAAYLVQDMEADGFSMESVSQGSNLTGVLIDMEGMIKDGRLRCINDNDLMKIHMLDAALKFEEGTNRRRLIKMNARAHIDGMAALSDAICMRHNYYEEMQAQLSNKR